MEDPSLDTNEWVAELKWNLFRAGREVRLPREARVNTTCAATGRALAKVRGAAAGVTRWAAVGSAVTLAATIETTNTTTTASAEWLFMIASLLQGETLRLCQRLHPWRFSKGAGAAANGHWRPDAEDRAFALPCGLDVL